MSITKREAALRELSKLVGVHEGGSNNRGRMVDIIEAADSLPGNGYSWCQSTQNYAWLKANGEKLAGGTASVWAFVRWAVTSGRAVVNPKDGPRRGDHVTFAFHAGGPFDHVGQIERVLKVGPVMYLQTIEGNTGAAGAVSDPGTGRDGVYRKRRVVARTSIDIVRVWGNCPHPERYVKKPSKPAKVTQKAKDALLVARMKRHGIVNPIWTLAAARKAGLPIALACAFLEQESGKGRNVFGHDPSIFRGAGKVTAAKYGAYRKARRASGNRKMQGVGPMQLTWWSLQDEADLVGGCWKPYPNMVVGFSHAAQLVRRNGMRPGVRAYNGSGPAAEKYADAVLAKAHVWAKHLARPL